MTAEQPANGAIATAELARLRRVEEAAKHLLTQMEGRRSATQMLSAVAELRAALTEKREDEGRVSP